MPARDSFGDRERMESRLEVEELRALLEVSRFLGVPRYAWHLEPMVARFVEILAFSRVSEELEEAGASRSASEERAALWLGLSVDTMRARRRRAGVVHDAQESLRRTG